MAKRRTKTKRSSTLPGIAALLAVLFISALGLYRFLETERGTAFLLDIGFDSRYAVVHENLQRRIVGGLHRAGINDDCITIASKRSTEPPGKVTLVSAIVPPDASLINVNNEVDKLVRAGGGRVRSCHERAGGRRIAMEIGTRSAVTHLCIVGEKAALRRAAAEGHEHPVIALIVDDFGFFNNALVTDFLALDIPLTISVIPGLKHSARICRQAARSGKTVLCHLPMEPEDGSEDVGDIPLVRVRMDARHIEHVVERALETTPGVAGMNNHMGSRATADRRVMEAVLGVCRKHGLFFIDSMTTSRSVAHEVARDMGVPSVRNDIFIDNRNEDTRENMHKLISIAERRGRAVGILHVRRASLGHLRWLIQEARRAGIRFCAVSELVGTHDVARREGGSS